MFRRVFVVLLACFLLSGCKSEEAARKPELTEKEWEIVFNLVEAELLTMSDSFKTADVTFSEEENAIMVLVVTEYSREMLLKIKEGQEGIDAFQRFAEAIMQLINAHAAGLDLDIVVPTDGSDSYGSVFDYYGGSVVIAAGDLTGETIHFSTLPGEHSFTLLSY